MAWDMNAGLPAAVLSDQSDIYDPITRAIRHLGRAREGELVHFNEYQVLEHCLDYPLTRPNENDGTQRIKAMSVTITPNEFKIERVQVVQLATNTETAYKDCYEYKSDNNKQI